jgi:hypothetical protein
MFANPKTPMATLVKSASVFLDRLEFDDMMRIPNFYIAQGKRRSHFND